jgi:hypothetical protein
MVLCSGNFHGSCTACKLTGSNFNCGCWSGLKKGKNDFGNRVHRTSIDLSMFSLLGLVVCC